MLSSKTFVISKLQTLTDGDILKMKENYVKSRHTRFTKSSYHLLFGIKDANVKEIIAADFTKLPNLIRGARAVS